MISIVDLMRYGRFFGGMGNGDIDKIIEAYINEALNGDY